jgi:hypothetical protein
MVRRYVVHDWVGYSITSFGNGVHRKRNVHKDDADHAIIAELMRLGYPDATGPRSVFFAAAKSLQQ